MSEDRRRIRIGPGAVRRVGEPNVLSDAATPNQLSGMVTRPANVQVGAREGSETWLATGAAAPARSGIRLPSFGTVIFLGFLAITGFRLLGEVLQGLEQQAPAPTTATGPEATQPGTITFGRKSDGDCGVLETGVTFEAGTEVWWSAQLATVQAADAAVVVIVRRDGTEVDREDVPPDAGFGEWSVLCSGAPVVETVAGAYRVEVWDEKVSILYAAGEYRVTPG